MTMIDRARRALAVICCSGWALGCVAKLPPPNPTPTVMQFDPNAVPPRVPQPTSLVINPATGHIDFSLAGLTLPDDCMTSVLVTPAECEFDKYLESLDGFPTVTPASAPASAALDMATLTAPNNIVVVPAKAASASLGAGGAVTPLGASDLTIAFDTTGNNIDLRPVHWTVGEFYWLAVRGYTNGVRGADGSEVVAAPAQFLLKQGTSLTCGATPPGPIDPSCPAFVVVSGTAPSVEAATTQTFQLEQVREAFVAGHGYDLMNAAGLPKAEIAVIWGFPIHTNSVAELDPSVGLTPRVTAPNEIHVAVQGPVDAATVRAFVLQMQAGSVVVIDLTTLAAAQAGQAQLPDAFPPVTATYANGDIVITGSQPFTMGHQIGLFFTQDIKSPDGQPLVPSPVSKLLTLPSPLVNSSGQSNISTVSNSDAQMLEVGRMGLAPLFDNALLAQLTGISRDTLVYTFAFTLATGAQQ
jgi:hypothetical protein